LRGAELPGRAFALPDMDDAIRLRCECDVNQMCVGGYDGSHGNRRQQPEHGP
jgi:hypothetical protein